MDRFAFHAEADELREAFSLPESISLPQKLTHYNISPGVESPIVIEISGRREIVKATWGFKSRNSNDQVSSISQEEAVSDSVLSDLIQTQPCIIPANGFYKWKQNVDDPLPFYLRVINTDITALAGVYTTSVQADGEMEYYFAVLTMPANALVEPLDDTMPCILQTQQIDKWLNGDAFTMTRKGFNGQSLLPHMAVYRVHDLVNDKKNNSPELIQPIPKLRDDD